MAVAVKTDWINSLFTSSATPKATKKDSTSSVALEMLDAGSGDGACDSYLLLKNGLENHTLTLVLKVYLNKILPEILPKTLRLPMFDADTPPRMFLIRPWQLAEWTAFQKNFKSQCARWNDRFW